MELANPFFPMRAVIRYKARQQLLQDVECVDLCIALDGELFKELTATRLRSPHFAQLFAQCKSKAEAVQVEDQVAAEVAQTYKQIKLNQVDIRIQRLNQLLDE